MNYNLNANKNATLITETKIKFETKNLQTENELLKKDNKIHIAKDAMDIYLKIGDPVLCKENRGEIFNNDEIGRAHV